MAFKREDELKKVTDALAYVATVCRLRGLQGLFDSNTLAERFFARFLSVMRKRTFQNMNLIRLNFPAIDVADESAGECVQITTDKSSKKVQKTLDKYESKTHEDKKICDLFPKLQVLVIGKRQKAYDKLSVPGTITFNPDDDIIGIDELIKEVEKLGTDTLRELAKVVAEEIRTPGHDVMPMIGVVVTEPDAHDPQAASLLVDLTNLSTLDVESELNERKQTLPERTAAELERISRFVGKESLAAQVAYQYNLERQSHLNEFRGWLEFKSNLERLDAHSVEFALWLSNESETPAIDLEAELKFPPECVRVLDTSEGESLPALPAPPRPPQIPPVAVGDFHGFSVRVQRISVDLPKLPNLGMDADLSDAKAIAPMRFACHRLRPGENRKLAELRAILHPNTGDSVEISYKVFGENLPKPPTGKIKIFVERE